MESVLCVLDHLLVDFVNAARHGFCKMATTNDGVELKRDVHAAEFVLDELLAVAKLVGYLWEALEFLHRMGDTAQEYRFFVFVNGYFCGC